MGRGKDSGRLVRDMMIEGFQGGMVSEGSRSE